MANIEHYLSSMAQKQLDVINILDEKDSFLTLSELAHEVGISKTTVQRIVKSFDFFSEFSGIYLEVGHKGCRLTKELNASVKPIRIQLVKKELLFLIIENSLYESFTKVSHFLSGNFLSTGVYYNEIDKITDFFSLHGLELDPKTTVLNSSEKNIRFGLYQVYWSLFGWVEWPFKTVSKTKLNLHLNHIEEQMGIKFSLSEREKIVLFLGVCEIRLKKGFLVQEEKLFSANLKNTPLYNELKKGFLIHLEKRISNKELESEVEYMILVISMISESIGDLVLIYDQRKQVVEAIVSLSIQTLLELEAQFHFSLDSRIEHGIRSLHRQAYYFRQACAKTQVYQPLYFLLAKKVITVLMRQDEKEQYFLRQNEEWLIQEYAWHLELYHMQGLLEEKISTKIYSSKSSSYEQLLERKVGQRFPDKVKLLASIENKEQQAAVELYVLDADIPVPEGANVFIWHTVPTVEDFEQLASEISRLYAKKIKEKYNCV